MNAKKNQKPYWKMTTEELREATKQFDEEFVADLAKPMSAKMKAKWELAKAERPCDEEEKIEQTVTIRLNKALLDRCTALAKKKRLSRDVLVARGLRALLAAEGE
jgi:predicted ArsR family transcriptional regulator